MKDANYFDTTTFSYIGEMMRYVSKTPADVSDNKNQVKSAFGPGLRPDIWRTMVDRFGPIHFAELYGLGFRIYQNIVPRVISKTTKDHLKA